MSYKNIILLFSFLLGFLLNGEELRQFKLNEHYTGSIGIIETEKGAVVTLVISRPSEENGESTVIYEIELKGQDIEKQSLLIVNPTTKDENTILFNKNAIEPNFLISKKAGKVNASTVELKRVGDEMSSQ